MLQYAEIHKASLKTFLREAVATPEVKSQIADLDSIIRTLSETTTMVPLIFMRLLYKATVALKPKPDEVDVVSGIGTYGQYLAVTAKGIRLGEVRFIVDYSDGLEMNAYLHLTQDAMDLINQHEGENVSAAG